MSLTRYLSIFAISRILCSCRVVKGNIIFREDKEEKERSKIRVLHMERNKIVLILRETSDEKYIVPLRLR